MDHKLFITNSLTRKKENFKPLNSPFVGLYVCGPTVYGKAHLGHARPAITFDVLFRYLTFLGYKVRYVRNITDVGHLENDADSGEDKVAKKARLEQLEPMELVQRYLNSYHDNMQKLNVLSPSIEPQASGHIIEQQEMIKKIIDNGFAYESNGSIYFDVDKYNEKYQYGKLSGRNTEDMLANTRELTGQEEKRNPFDFALWKKADPVHIMRWKTTFKYKNGKYDNKRTKYKQFTSDGFPGWHLECSAMGTKYLGETFDIHGGGMDLLFPHHECEIAQSVAANGVDHVKTWMHNNMITINGQKMGKSLNNFIDLDDFFSGNHHLLERAYSPMTIRFFILQAHYRSTVDFSNEALQAAEKGFKRLLNATDLIGKLKPSASSSFNLSAIITDTFEALNDDLNTPVAISQLFEAARIINLINDGKETISGKDLEELAVFFKSVLIDILGLISENSAEGGSNLESDLMQIIIDIRLKAKQNKDFQTSDLIRDRLGNLKVNLKDTKEGTTWEKA